MKRALIGMGAFLIGVALLAGPAASQPPEGKKDGKFGKEGKDGKFGGPRFELGQVLPPPLVTELNLTAAQQKELDAIQQDLKTKLDKLLTAEQKKTIENFRPRGPGGFGGGGPGGKGGDKGGGDKGKGPPPGE
jgi:hypothetical protein